MQISARNRFKGTVKQVHPGALNTEVIVELSDGLEEVSIITTESAERLKVALGAQVYAVLKARDVMFS
jgi:molybdopterin-binding protein